MILTYRYRIKANAADVRTLSAMAVEVNQIWNYCGGAQEHARRHNQCWPSWITLMNKTAGVSREVGLHSDTVQGVCKQWTEARDATKRRPKWRASRGAKRALGWIPFKAARAIKLDGDAVVFLKRRYRLWLSHPVNGEIKCGSFNEDARGRWYINLQVEVAEAERRQDGPEIGVDLGLKSLASLSTGEVIRNPQHFAREESALATAQRAGRKTRARAIHAKIANRRRHEMHVLSTRLVRGHQRIIVGDVSSSRLAKTKMAKSVLDAGWSMLRQQLRYKAIRHGVEYLEVDERYSSQLCSACHARSGPRGLEGLRVRDWICSECGAVHNRDICAALNILSFGQERLPPVTGKPRPLGRGGR